MGLIDKDIIVAEIEKKIKQYKNERNTIIKDTDNSKELASRIIMCQEIISFLDTLEAKEVDLNKENKNLKMLLDVIDYSFLQTDGSYDKSLTYPVIDKVLFIKKNII